MATNKTNLDQLRIDRSEVDEAPMRRWLAVLAILVLLAAALSVWWWTSRPGAAQVRTATAREAAPGVGGTVLNASGYVTARRQATVSSKVTGKVVEVLIEEGMKVRKGQVLARLDDSNVSASLRLAEAQLVSAGTALGETEALLAEAGLNLRRTEDLVAREISSQAALDRARAEADSLEARLGRQSQEIEVARRRVELWQQQLEDTIIRAPFAGVVVSKNAQPGEMISPISAGGGFTRTGIGTVVDMASLEIEVDVNEAYIHRVEAEQSVVATLDAYPEWAIPCTVIAIIPTADRQRATVEVRVGFDALDPRILPDMGVKVAFQEDTDTAAAPGVLVPASAIRRTAGRDTILIVREGLVERRAITVGEALGEEVAVLAGLAAGEIVITEGPDDLMEGDRVEETE